MAIGCDAADAHLLIHKHSVEVVFRCHCRSRSGVFTHQLRGLDAGQLDLFAGFSGAGIAIRAVLDGDVWVGSGPPAADGRQHRDSSQPSNCGDLQNVFHQALLARILSVSVSTLAGATTKTLDQPFCVATSEMFWHREIVGSAPGFWEAIQGYLVLQSGVSANDLLAQHFALGSPLKGHMSISKGLQKNLS